MKATIFQLFSVLCIGLITFSCSVEDGVDGYNSLLKVSEELSGTNCEFGGLKIETGLDLNRNGILENEEVEAIEYYCNENELPDIYATVINQTETNNPESIVIKNDLDISIVWTRISQGIFEGNIDNDLDLEKTVLSTNNIGVYCSLISPNIIRLANTCGVNAFCDGFSNLTLEIKVFD